MSRRPASFLEIQAEQRQQRGSGFRGGRYHNHPPAPLEHGLVCSLKDGFGFIRSPDRPDEVFFHFSTLRGVTPEELQVETTIVQFRVQDNRGRLAATDVQVSEQELVWEEDHGTFRGLVERSIRHDARGRPTTEGTIRLLSDNDNEKGPLVRFAAEDYTGSLAEDATEDRAPQRLSKGDLVHGKLVYVKRTKQEWARSIDFVQSERARHQWEAEQKLLREATVEEGVVTELKGDHGFLKSKQRRERIFFHYSSIELEEDHGDELVLKEGQDMKFLVVQEEGGRRASARQVQTQPRGSVVFSETLAEGVTGVVKECPQPIDSAHALEHHGRVRLSKPLVTKDEEGNDKTVEEVYLSTEDSPGGIYGHHGGTLVGLWITEGDTLLFDIVQDYVDGAYRAAPTKYLLPRDGDEEANQDVVPAVRLIELTLAMRAEGVINAVKDAFGFLHYAERPVDVHFKLHQILPDPLQEDLRRNMGLPGKDHRDRPLGLRVGTDVQFDLSVHGTIMPGSRRGRPSAPHERENLKAQRILFLPPNTLGINVQLVSEMNAIVGKEDGKQPYVGTVDLEKTVMTMEPEQRHPLVAKLLQSYADSDSTDPIVFRDIQSKKEDEVITGLIDSKYKGKLAWCHVAVEGETHYAGCLKILKASNEESTESTEIPKDDSNTENDPKENESKPTIPTKKKKQHKSALKKVDTVRFDKSSLCPELKDDAPPSAGDKVIVDLVQSRRTGHILVQNMRMVERAEQSGKSGEGIGVVREVNNARRFGFISVFDEAASKSEMLFFSFNSVADVEDQIGPNIRRGDEVSFEYGRDKNGKPVAKKVTVVAKGTIPTSAAKNACKGIILMEPVHTLRNAPVRNSTPRKGTGGASQGRWNTEEEEKGSTTPPEQDTELGCILVTEDPSNVLGVSDETEKEQRVMQLRYRNGALAIQGVGSFTGTTTPKRGDAVSFSVARNGKTPRDIRLVDQKTAHLLRGRLVNIELGSEGGGTAKFISSTESEEEYSISLAEVISCEPSVLKEDESVEGIVHDGAIFGLCRTVDLYLESKLGSNHKERPKLNLTVKKDLAGKIMAQSMMAKGPDGTNGFTTGWTKRVSPRAVADVEESDLSGEAAPWTPSE